MSKWFNKITSNPDDLTPLVEAIIWFEDEVETARSDCRIKGSVEKASSELPGMMQHRFNQLQELEAILKYLEIRMTHIHGQAFRKYLEGYNRDLKAREAEKFADSDKTVIEIALLINQVSLVRNSFLGIIKGLEFKHYQLGHLIKLKTAGLEDYEIN